MNKIKKIKTFSVLQHDLRDCGVACLASIIRYYGGDAGLEKLRNFSGTGKSGTTMLGLYQAAGKIGLIAEGFEANIADIIYHPLPLILHVLTDGKLEHFVVCFGYEKDKFILWDPSRGLVLMDQYDLGNIWKSGKCLSLYPGNEFISQEQQGNSKRRWIISMLKPDRDILFVSVIMGILVSSLGIVMAIYTQKLIDKILPSGEMRILLVSSALVLLLLSTRLVIASVRQLLLLTQGRIFSTRVVDDFFSSIMYLRKSFFDTRKTGDFVARLNDTMRLQRVTAEVVSIYIIDVLIIIITIAALFHYSPVAGAISVLCLPVFYLLASSRNKKILTSQHELMAGYASSESNFIDSIKGITEIKSLNWQDLFSKRNKAIYSDFQSKIVNLGLIKVKLNLITGFLSSFYLIILLVWSAQKVMISELSQGELMAIISLGSGLLPSIVNIALISIPISEVKAAISRMFEFTQMESEKEQNKSIHENIKIQSLEIKNMSFRYPGQKLLLDRINIKLKVGEIISVVGESGCGKSTLAGIMLRFYTFESGSMKINNKIDVSRFSVGDWRSKLAIIPQEVHIFNGTILQNLIPEANESSINEMLATITELGLIPFIKAFPSGLSTLVGEEGINLSGGQKQVLAFIRVILAKPDFVIIDEGTSNMDKGTEALITEILTKMKSKIGIMLISHKLNLIRILSDKIYVLEDKTINSYGTHDDLIMADNFYSRSWKDFKGIEIS